MAITSSLRVQLLSWLLVPLAGLLVIYAWSSYRNARAVADVVYDNALLASARGIAEQVHETDGVIEVLIPPSAIERLSSPQRDRVVYRVIGPGGQLLAGYPDVPDPPSEPKGFEPLPFDSTFRGMPIRAVAIGQPVTSTEAKRVIVIVGETLLARERMVSDLWEQTMWRDVLMVGIAIALVLIGLRRGLAPLMRLHDAVVARDPRSLDRLDVSGVQSELKPLVQALNAAIDRIERQIERRRQWIADAAHQLRTPLSLLRTQAAVGLRSTQVDEKDGALAAVDTTAFEMSRLAHQLLTLAEVDSAHTASEHVDLTETARHALSNVAARALNQGVKLELIASKPAHIVGNATLLGEVVANLLDNALHYTPRGGAVTSTVEVEKNMAKLTVTDTGPGIPAAEREKVFERFYRVPGTGVDGSGLGLAIVREIIRSHGGSVTLKDPAEHAGLEVVVVLPTAPIQNT